jgi:predicted HicB family RNase H-like nuclease
MRSKYRNREPYGERLEIALTPEQKRRAFDLADRQNISVGALVRRAIDSLAQASA